MVPIASVAVFFNSPNGSNRLMFCSQIIGSFVNYFWHAPRGENGGSFSHKTLQFIKSFLKTVSVLSDVTTFVNKTLDMQ